MRQETRVLAPEQLYHLPSFNSSCPRTPIPPHPGLPGSNGSASRAHAAEAGLIIIMTGNFLIMLLSALVDVPTGTAGIARGSDDGKVTV